MKILVMPGIGDTIWCLLKAQDLAKDYDNQIELRIAIWESNIIESRAKEFLARFNFVKSVELYKMPRIGDGPFLKSGRSTDADGCYRYITEGLTNEYYDIDYVMCPNSFLEKGKRIEDWLPQYKINWQIMDEFNWLPKEIEFGNTMKEMGKYAVFFMGSNEGNTTNGHNRNGLWSPDDWVDLGEQIYKIYGLKIVVVGADYDLSYFNNNILKKVINKSYWINMIGKLHICNTFAICKNSNFVISYQSGIGIVSHYLGKPVVIFWRPKGNSTSPHTYISFSEKMASAWADPKGKLMPCIYGREKVTDILYQIQRWEQ